MERELSADALMFFDRAPQFLSLYQELDEKLRALGEVRVKVQKSQISYANRYGFAALSLPGRKLKGWTGPYLLVTFGLGRRLDHPRVAAAAEPYPGRWTHHVPVAAPEDLDDTLMAWLEEAYTFSLNK